MHITSILTASAKVLDLSKLTDAESEAEDRLAGRKRGVQAWSLGLVLVDLKATPSH